MSAMASNEELFPWEAETAAGDAARGGDAAPDAAADAGPAAAPDAPPAAADAAAKAASAATSAAAAAVQADEPEAEAEPDAAAADGAPDANGDPEEDAVFEAARARAERDFAPSSPTRERRIAPREYYSISEVCEITGLKPHVLRYWEAQFPLLNPSKNRSGNRVYQRKEIRLILLVKQLLYEEKYTVEGAKAKLEQLRGGGELGDATSHALDRQMLKVLRSELRQLVELLTPPRAQ